MKQKKFLLAILVILMVGLFAGFAQAASPAVFLDGQQIEFDVEPTIENGRTLVPLRAIFESLGANVVWEGNTSTVTATKGEINISLQIGNKVAYRNSQAVELDVPGKIIQGRTMVPLRFVGEALDCSVNWNGVAYRVEISSKGSAIAQKNGVMTAHFIDVGQGDSILIELSSGKNILIDAGENSSPVISYLKKNNITRLDAIIVTHPHGDHIGGIADVVRGFEVGSFYMPRVTHTTKTFENMIDAIKNKGLKVTEAKAGVSLDVGQEFNAYFVAPNSAKYDNLNNYSAVLKIELGNTGYLLTGDAEELSEAEMLCAGSNPQADLLKVGHHGSNTSSTTAFLNAVKPQFAVISVGSDNKYGHPSAETLARLQNAGAKIYRTDEHGSIIAVSDGVSITINKSPSAVKTPASNTVEPTINVAPAPSADSGKYIGNKNSKKFHLPTCRSLPAPDNRVYFDSREEAVSQGYTPCGLCKP